MDNNFKYINEIPSSSLEIKKSILSLNSEKDIKKGKFETILNIGSLSHYKPIVSLIFNDPIFQLSVNLNPQNNPPRCVVLIGIPREDTPRDRKVFSISTKIIEDVKTEHSIVVCWENWKILRLEINGEAMGEL